MTFGHEGGKIGRGSGKTEDLAVEVEYAIPPGGGVGSLFGQDKVGCWIGEGSVAKLFAEDGSLGGRTPCTLEEIGIGTTDCWGGEGGWAVIGRRGKVVHWSCGRANSGLVLGRGEPCGEVGQGVGEVGWYLQGKGEEVIGTSPGGRNSGCSSLEKFGKGLVDTADGVLGSLDEIGS